VRGWKVAVVLTAGALAMAACGGKSVSGGSGDTTKKSVKVGMAYDIGGRGDKSFNDAAAVGLEKVKSDLNLDVKELSAVPNEPDSAKEERLRLLAQKGYNPIVAVGFAYAGPLAAVAKEYPNIHFAIIDGVVDKAANVEGLTFAEHEGSFLVGAAAALKTKTNSVGYIGGCLVPLLQKFQAGFTAGAKAVKPDIKVQVKYLSTTAEKCTGFNDPAAGKTTANGMYQAGADIIFAAAGGSGSGVFQAAKASSALAIGVDSDQYNSADPAVRDVILTSMVKHVEVAVFDFVKNNADGKFTAGVKVYDLKADGVGYATSGGKVDDIKSKLDDYKQQIIDGKITVPSTPAS
jgi:basic membrane protein A